MAFEWSVAQTPMLAAATLSLLLAGALLVYDHRGRASRLFAAFLVTRALVEVLRWLAAGFTTEGPSTVFHRLSVYFLVAQIPALALFLMHYPRRRPWVRSWMQWAVVAPFVLALTLYSINMDWWGELRFSGETLLARRTGWLSWLAVLARMVPLVAAIVLFQDVRRHEPGPRRDVLRLLTIGFWWHAAYFGGVFLIVFVAQGIPPMNAGNPAWVDFGLNVTHTVGFALALSLAIAVAVRDTANRTLAIRLLSAGAIIVAIAFLATGWANGLWGLPRDTWLVVISRAATFTALPALATYALLKCRLFDIDVRVKFVLGQSTFASIVGFTFWLLTSLISEAVEPDGIWPSIVAGALVAVAFKPIHMLAMRFADKVMPNAKRLSDMDPDERQQLYEEQVQLAWTDRIIGEKERRILENLRDRLEISKQQASSIEGRILSGA